MVFRNGGVENMKKTARIILMISVCVLFLTGCGRSGGTITVETQSYSEDGGKLDKGGWQKNGSVEAVTGEVIYTNGQLTATVGNVSKDSVQVRFSGQVVNKEDNKPGDIFDVKRNRTYTFVAGGGASGFELKLRYN